MSTNIITAILFSIGILFLLFQLYPLFKSSMTRGKKVSKLTGIVPDTVTSQRCYLIYFWSPSCGMCRNMTPMIDELSQQRDDVAKIDVSQHPETSKALGVLGTPAIVLIENGVIKKVSLGVKTKSAILKLLGERPNA